MSVAQYASTEQVEWDLGDHKKDQEGLNEAILSLNRVNGRTFTYSAITNVLTRELEEQNYGRRPDVPLILVLITDGHAKV